MSDEPAIRPRITVHGDEGALFEYYPFAGPDYSPGETGWVLVLTGTPQVIDPQAVTVSDVLGDLLSMLPDEPSGPVILRVATEEMITVLERGQAAPPRHPGEPEVAERLAALRQELREAFPD